MLKNVVAIDLFCGIGGLTYGLQQAGIKVLAGVDIDSSCKYAYEKNNNAIFINKSIKNIKSEEISSFFSKEDIKIFIGCAPCQPFSNYQTDKTMKTKHKDWNLLDEFLRLILQCNPDIISMENVPTLLKQDIFNKFVKTLQANNYFITYKIHDAQNYGVPQRRNRLVLLASKFGQIDFLNIKEQRKTVKEVIGDLPKIKAGEIYEKDLIHRSSKLNKLNLQRIIASIPGKTWESWPLDLLPECYKRKSGATYKSVYGRMKWDDVAPTLTTQFYNYGTGRYGHPEQDRAISLREGALLQSFPRNYIFIENDNFKFTEVARHIGNAVPPKLAEYIGKTIINHLKRKGLV
ncbi:DNA cytosine methyltransferase [uncultured Fusobacterium sp.]|uniref:DNA cytosine methyltransferase n=1 Tax=uncultured Fusobacterium sp. TaxID=159267 RepID=UPI0025FAA422|nr:DNA cytosine methyltransferase [uncultured Fusobacterium sp.]